MVKSTFWFVVIGLIAFMPQMLSAQTLRQIPDNRALVQYSFAPVVKKALPAVVNVFASKTNRLQHNPLFDDPVFRQFFGVEPRSQTEESLGSGVILDANGLVVTNLHVIAGMTAVKIALSDRREFEAEILLRDERTDLAVLKIKAPGPFPFLELGGSDGLEIGDLVLAIGNPFGVGQTVTQGIVSALARTRVDASDMGFFIQTDAAINPGNSGGALVDMNGRLIGINSSIYSQTGSSIGIGFAIPADIVRGVVTAAHNGGHSVQRPWLGAKLQTITHEIADSLGFDRPTGVLVAEIFADSPAMQAGLQRGDVITTVDGKAVDDAESFGYRFGTHELNGTANFGILRAGKNKNIEVALRSAPEIPPRDERKIAGASPLAGLSVLNLSPAVAEELSLPNSGNGVVVSSVEDNSPAQQIGFNRNDVIVAVNDVKIGSTRELEKIVSVRKAFWKLSIDRGGQIITSVFGD